MSSEVADKWASTTLKDAAGALFTDGDWVESKDQDPNGEVRLIQLADIGDGSFLDKSARFLTADKARELRCTFLEPGDLLIARMADPIARCCLFPGIDQPAATVVDVSIVRPGSFVDREYLAYAVSNPVFRSEALGSASGTTRSRISRSNLGAISLPLPPLGEQRRIAEVLRSVDEAIAAASLVIAQADEAFEAVLADLFSRYGDASTKLKSYCLAGGLQTGPFGSQLKADDYVDFGVPIIMPVDLTPKGMNFVAAKKAPVAKSRELARHILQPGDVLFARRGEIGRCGLYLEGDPVAMCGTGCLRARLDVAKIDPALAYFLIQSRQARDWLRAHAVGATMPNLNTAIIGELPMPDIPKAEQGAWVDALLMIEGTQRINQGALVSYQITKSTLTSDLLSGRVRVPA